MSVYVKGMKKPENCYKCPFRKREGVKIICSLSQEKFSVAEVNILSFCLNNCPLIEVPPHGRLIDADALLEHMKQMHDKWKMGEHYTPTTDDEITVMYMPTIIPADGGKV